MNVSKSGTDFEHEYRLLLPDGRVKHVHAIAHAFPECIWQPRVCRGGDRHHRAQDGRGSPPEQ